MSMIIINLALCFFVVGGIASASGPSWWKWTTLAFIASPVVAGPALVAAIIIRGRGHGELA
jgi:hypothetical protein